MSGNDLTLAYQLLTLALFAVAGFTVGFIIGDNANENYVKALEAENYNLQLGNEYMKERIAELTDRDARGRFVKRGNASE